MGEEGSRRGLLLGALRVGVCRLVAVVIIVRAGLALLLLPPLHRLDFDAVQHLLLALVEVRLRRRGERPRRQDLLQRAAPLGGEELAGGEHHGEQDEELPFQEGHPVLGHPLVFDELVVIWVLRWPRVYLWADGEKPGYEERRGGGGIGRPTGHGDVAGI